MTSPNSIRNTIQRWSELGQILCHAPRMKAKDAKMGSFWECMIWASFASIFIRMTDHFQFRAFDVLPSVLVGLLCTGMLQSANVGISMKSLCSTGALVFVCLGRQEGMILQSNSLIMYLERNAKLDSSHPSRRASKAVVLRLCSTHHL